jgi:peptide deformylase
MFFKKKTIPTLLKLTEYQDPILRKVTNTVSFPLSEEDKQIIEEMKYSIQDDQLKKANAPFESAAGMAANQWGIDRQIFLFSPKRGLPIEVIINPSYEPISEEVVQGWEGCFSVPLALSHVERPVIIKAKYQNELGEPCEQILSDWTARIFQHETDHLNGILNDSCCLEKKTFASKNELDAFYRK